MRAVLTAPGRGGVRLADIRAACQRVGLVLLGLGVTFPVFLAPGQTSAPRLGDLALLVGLPLVLVEWGRMGAIGRAAGPVAVLVLTVTLLLQMMGPDQGLDGSDVAFWFRWMAGVLVAPAVGALILRDARRRRLFFAAILVGAVCHLATYGLLSLIGRAGLEAVGLASPRAAASSVAAHARLTTLAEHPNAAMAMMGLAAPSALLLIGRRRAGLVLMATGVGVVTVAFLATLSRGGLVATGMAGLARIGVGWRWREPFRPMGWVLAVCCLAVVAIWLQNAPTDRSVDRFSARFDVVRLEDNVAGRMATWRRTADFVLAHPLGVGWTTAEEMGTFRAQSVSHNGYLFMARTTGLAFAGLVLGLHLLSASRLDALTPQSVYLLGMMFVEDLAQGAGFVFLICLVAAVAWRRPLAP